MEKSSILQTTKHPLIASRISLLNHDTSPTLKKTIQEGGCGVVGFASDIPIRGRHIFEPSVQMHNRGNGKGGGIAAACLMPEQLGVDQETLNNAYILQIACLDNQAETEIETNAIIPSLTIHHKTRIQPTADYRDIGLEVKPPDIVRYFVRVKQEQLTEFAQKHQIKDLPERSIEDEFIYQNSFRLNQKYYASLGEKRAFVLSHARNLLIFKIVGYAEQVVRYYDLENFKAHIWIAHQRYPTKGRVWHPAGSHPFIGMNEALVHNGDFANYLSVTNYLRQHNIIPQFLTDTEVSVLLFDLLHRIYNYPLEYVIEAMAPTTELDFDHLPKEKLKIYKAIQALHIHGSPDGPWFFIIASSNPDTATYQLLGITDTSMLRPQVFAIQEGDVSIGLIASEKQAIDATLHSLSEEDQRFRLRADRYWNARGGSHTDGGAFSFTIKKQNSDIKLFCADKFEKPISPPPGEWKINLLSGPIPPKDIQRISNLLESLPERDTCKTAFDFISKHLCSWDFNNLQWLIEKLKEISQKEDTYFEASLRLLTLFLDRQYDCGNKRRSVVLELVDNAIAALLTTVPLFNNIPPYAVPTFPSGHSPFSVLSPHTHSKYYRIDWHTRHMLRPPESQNACLVLCARDFPPEGEECDARLAVNAYKMGWKRFIIYGLKGQRFTGCGFGPDTDDITIDVYGSSGDYLGSGIDGMEIAVHGTGQDQLGQIMKRGKLIVYDDVGQTFMYGAKGGEVYIMRNAAGRPLINAVGKPRVIINGTCLDYLAESFMAGDPHKGGGFIVLNGLEFDDHGHIKPQETPYPGSNLFSLASGGALYVRDPNKKLIPKQLNGGEFAELTSQDWDLILPYLKANEHYFGISIQQHLLTVDGSLRSPQEVYRKVRAIKLAVLSSESSPE